MIAISKSSEGVVRHLTCLRWAKVEIPVKPHCEQTVRYRQAGTRVYIIASLLIPEKKGKRHSPYLAIFARSPASK